MLHKDNLAKSATFLVLVMGLLVMPVFARNPPLLGFFILLFIYLTATVGLYPIMRMGQLDMGHAAFMAIGAYTSVLLAMNVGLSVWLSIPAGGVMAAVAASMVGYPTLRIKGLFFCVITFGINEIVRLFVVFGPRRLGGASGIFNIPQPVIAIPGLPTIDFASRVPWYYLVLALALVTIFIVFMIDRSRIGRNYRAIAENDVMAETIGINLMGYKVAIFTVGCFFAGTAGALLAHYYSVITPEDFGIWTSIYMMIYIQIGGPSSVLGPIAGVALLRTAPEVFRFALRYQPLILGVILMLAVVFLPEGIVRLPSELKVRIGKRKGFSFHLKRGRQLRTPPT